MPENKLAFARYFIIDACLINRQYVYPTKSYIQEKCCEKLDRNISMSTIEKDIQDMKHNSRLGFLAPISFDRYRKGYYYQIPGYSIRHLIVGKDMYQYLSQVIELMIQQLVITPDKKAAEAILNLMNTCPLNLASHQEEFIFSLAFQHAAA